MRFWVYFVRWFLVNRSVLICLVDKYRTVITKSILTPKGDNGDKGA